MTEATRFYTAWHEQELAGTRRVLDGIVAAEHRGPSAELAAFLKEWRGAWYWGDDLRSRLVLIHGSAPARPERWLWHGALLILTVITTLAAGAVLAHVWVPPSGGRGVSGAVSGALLHPFAPPVHWRCAQAEDCRHRVGKHVGDRPRSIAARS